MKIQNVRYNARVMSNRKSGRTFHKHYNDFKPSKLLITRVYAASQGRCRLPRIRSVPLASCLDTLELEEKPRMKRIQAKIPGCKKKIKYSTDPKANHGKKHNPGFPISLAMPNSITDEWLCDNSTLREPIQSGSQLSHPDMGGFSMKDKGDVPIRSMTIRTSTGNELADIYPATSKEPGRKKQEFSLSALLSPLISSILPSPGLPQNELKEKSP